MTEIETKEWFDELEGCVGYDNATYTTELLGLKHPYDDISIERFISLVEKYKKSEEQMPIEVKRKKICLKDRYLTYKKDEYRCVICGSEKNLTIDHLFPVAKGGRSEAKNYVTMCDKCNLKKKDKTFLCFMFEKYKTVTIPNYNELIDFMFTTSSFGKTDDKKGGK